MSRKLIKELNNNSKEDLERKKLILEIKELQRKTRRRIIIIIVSALISIPTIWFYYKEFAEPFIQIDKIQLAKQLKELTDEYENKLNDISRQRDELENEKDSLADEKNKLEKDYLELNKQQQKQETEFQKQLKEIRDEYNKLSGSYQTKTKESEDFKRKVKSLNSQINEKDKLIKDLDKKIEQLELRKKELKFRSLPTYLSDVTDLIVRHNFYDSKKNPESKGFLNHYNMQRINGQKVVIDEATGLMWQQNGSGVYMNFRNAKERIRELNRKGLADYRDWRLPTVEEAMSLVEPEKSRNGLYIDSMFDRNQLWIWTSDQVKDESWTWVVDFKYGECLRFSTDRFSYVRAVRSVQSSAIK